MTFNKLDSAKTFSYLIGCWMQCDLKVASSQASDENFANYFLKSKANQKCFIVLKCKGLQQAGSMLSMCI